MKTPHSHSPDLPLTHRFLPIRRRTLLRLLPALLMVACSLAWTGRPSGELAVRDLRFDEFFRLPAGRKGLEPSETLVKLHGSRVRMEGYPLEMAHARAGCFVLSPLPVQSHDHDTELADDLPPAVVYVRVEAGADGAVTALQWGRCAVTGRLEVGRWEEPDGRRSLVRITTGRGSAGASPNPNAAHLPARRGSAAP